MRVTLGSATTDQREYTYEEALLNGTGSYVGKDGDFLVVFNNRNKILIDETGYLYHDPDDVYGGTSHTFTRSPARSITIHLDDEDDD